MNFFDKSTWISQSISCQNISVNHLCPLCIANQIRNYKKVDALLYCFGGVQNWNCRLHQVFTKEWVFAICLQFLSYFLIYGVAFLKVTKLECSRLTPHKMRCLRFCARQLCQCERPGRQIGPMLRRSYRVKLVPHLDFWEVASIVSVLMVLRVES